MKPAAPVMSQVRGGIGELRACAFTRRHQGFAPVDVAFFVEEVLGPSARLRLSRPPPNRRAVAMIAAIARV